ncbi:acyl-CoA dehydrogenase [Rhizobium sp. ACO-34A]|nr:acyl-CoA dehydrogenase family protein [Rhizobium sp. ACO-34A]ATN32297.1 acyl-CoA dehydrogenase [Rhizobium sp. ACO-34A]
MHQAAQLTCASSACSYTVEEDHCRRPVERPAFRQLLETIAARREGFEALRRVPSDVVDAMKAAGIFRAATPTRFGGDAMAPHLFLEMIDAIGTVDGSAAWVAAFGSANTYIAALPPETQAEIYAKGPDQVYAGGLYPVQSAERVANGWNVSGRWKFASGCMGADWIGVGISSTSAGDGGAPVVRMAVAPASDVEIVETWDAVGLLGTGSHDTIVTNRFYPDAWTCERGTRGIFDEPLYRYPPLAYQAQVHAAVNLGLARAGLDLAREMSGAAKLMPGAPVLANRAYFLTGLAEGEARLRAARAFYYETAQEAWSMLQHEKEVSPSLVNMMRLSASHAARESLETLQTCYRVAGMVAAMRSSRMQHILRDAMVVSQHAALNDATFENAGAMLVGMPVLAGYP